MKFKTTKILIAISITVILLFSIKLFSIHLELKAQKANNDNISYSLYQRPFYNDTYEKQFIAYKRNVQLHLWAKGLTGNIAVTIADSNNQVIYKKEFKQVKENISLNLESNVYKLTVNIKDYTGGVYVGFKNACSIYKLPDSNYEIINSNTDKGFDYQYILYTPNKVNNKNILVMPNNTGTISENIEVHKNSAISLIMNNSEMATKLSVPLLVPIFPRANDDDVMYTHSLDRNTILVPKNKRLDIQLIGMVKDCQNRLRNRGIDIENKILMSGFSAAGDFTDRFSFLHPDIVKAAAIGGCDNMVPFKNYKGENLPYPMGVYDYKNITGKDFNLSKFANIKRFIYKGSKDEGGWITVTEDNGKSTTYTGLEHYNKFTAPNIKKLSETKPTPLFVKGELSPKDKDIIVYRVYNKVLIEKFNLIKDLFKKNEFSNSEFKVYNNIAHTITAEMKNDLYQFFKQILND